MDRVMKISSNQSGAITATKNLVDFDIPAGMVYDLSKSYMVINSSIETTDTNPVAAGNASGGAGVYNCFLNYKQDTDSDINFKNKCLVKNVSMYSQREGMVEDIKRSDVLQFNLDQYKDDVDTKVNASYNQISSILGANGQDGIRWSPHRRLSPLGLEASDNLDREIRIGLSEVMNSCNNIWDGNRFGNTRVHAELNITQLEVAESLNTADAAIFTATDGGGGTFSTARGIMTDVAGGGTDQITLTTTRTYANPKEDSPFYVGMKIKVTAGTVAGDTRVGYVRQIAGIDHNSDGTLLITLDLTLGAGASASITVVGENSATKVANFDSAELVLYVTDKTPPPMIAFATYKLEEDSFYTGTHYNHQFYLESDVQNVFWGARSKDDVLAFDGVMTSYRMRESGVDKTDRDVKHGSSVHFNRVSRAFANSNMRIKNLSEAEFENDKRVSKLYESTAGTRAKPIYLIAETCEITETPKLLDVNIVGTSFGNICLFKQMIKTL